MKQEYESPAAEAIPLILQANCCESSKGTLPNYEKKTDISLDWDD